MTTSRPSRLTLEILEMATAQRRVGLMSDETLQEITARHLGPEGPPTAAPIDAAEVRALRERAQLSQAALARYLNSTVGYVSRLERGAKQAKGPALALLNVIRRKGIEPLR